MDGQAVPVVSYARISVDTVRGEHAVVDQHKVNRETAARRGVLSWWPMIAWPGAPGTTSGSWMRSPIKRAASTPTRVAARACTPKMSREWG